MIEFLLHLLKQVNSNAPQLFIEEDNSQVACCGYRNIIKWCRSIRHDFNVTPKRKKAYTTIIKIGPFKYIINININCLIRCTEKFLV